MHVIFATPGVLLAAWTAAVLAVLALPAEALSGSPAAAEELLVWLGRFPGSAGSALAAEVLAAQGGADMIRTHEPAPLLDALKVLAAHEAGKPPH